MMMTKLFDVGRFGKESPKDESLIVNGEQPFRVH